MNGKIKDKARIMDNAATVGAVTYLHDPRTLAKWERLGLVYLERTFDDWQRYKATDEGKALWMKGAALP